MDLSLIVYSALGAGGGAGLGAALFKLVQKLRDKTTAYDKDDKLGNGMRGGLAAGLAVLGLNIIPAQYKNMTLPRIFPLDHSEIAEDLPILDIINENSPEDYKRIVRLIDRAARNNKVGQTELNNIRAVLNDLISEKMSTASADVLRELENLSIAQLKVYKAKKPHICTLLFHGDPYPAVDEFFNEQEIKAEQDIMVKLFVDPPRNPDFERDLGQGEKIFNHLIAQSVEETGLENARPEISDALENNADNKLLHQNICDFSILFATKKIELADNDLMHVYDYLISAE